MDRLVTVFGGGGFLGRYVTQELLRAGARVRVASRDPSSAWFLKPLGALGQTQFVGADIGRAESVAAAVRGSDAVINLVGVLKGDFQRIHVDGARNVAEAAAAAGADALAHISAIGADPQAPSAYGRSKGEGEAAVRAAFPGAAILRPSILFGPEDGFVNQLARMAERLPVVPVIRGDAKFQPAFVDDVAKAIAKAALEPGRFAGGTFALGGPDVLSMRDLNAWIGEAIGRKRPILEVPDAVAEIVAKLGFLPGAPITRDQWLMLQQDNIVPAGAPGFEVFGIEPVPLGAVAPRWLVRYRRLGRFSTTRAAA